MGNVQQNDERFDHAACHKQRDERGKNAGQLVQQILDKAVLAAFFFGLAGDCALCLDGVCDMHDVHADDDLVFTAAVDRTDDPIDFFYFFKVYFALVLKIDAQSGCAVCQKRNVIYSAN
ncbi:hypothetical protein SDC9_93464 [bioreactor metagenome]|uniref:Uncharacterized protein n=1 Tax=bioreactor metagenome TaxID=1076179 RepID=A0A645A212_9ZZZZ